MPKSKLLLITAIVAALAGALLARIYFAPPPPIALNIGTALTPPKPLPTFALLDQHGQTFDNARLRGRWSLLFFGFTHCGDVCPTTLVTLASVAKLFPSADQTPQVVFISVDAARDTPDVVKAYVRNFHPDMIGVTGTQPQLDAFTREVGMPSTIRPLETGGYAVDHSAAIMVIDPNGAFRALFSPPHAVDSIAGDLRILMEASR